MADQFKYEDWDDKLFANIEEMEQLKDVVLGASKGKWASIVATIQLLVLLVIFIARYKMKDTAMARAKLQYKEGAANQDSDDMTNNEDGRILE